MKNTNKSKNNSAIVSYITGIFFIVYLFLMIPSEIPLKGEEFYLLSTGSGVWVDMFMRCKEIMLFIFSVFAVLFFVSERIFPENPIKPVLGQKRARILLVYSGIYLLFVFISALASKHRYVTFWGFASESEGVAASVGYIVLFFLAYNYIHTEKQKNIFYKFLFILSSLIVLSALFELFVGSISELIYSKQLLRLRISLMFGNPNCFGSVCVLLFPFSVLYSLAEERTVWKLIKTAVAGLLVLSIVISGSSAAFLGFAVEAVLLFIFIIYKIKFPLKKLIIRLLPVFICAVLLLAVNAQKAVELFNSVLTNSGGYSNEKEYYRVRFIDLTKEGILIENSDREQFVIPRGITNAKAFIQNNKNDSIKYSWESGVLKINLGYSVSLRFLFDGDLIYYIGINGCLEEKLQRPAFPELDNFYNIATGRGYIWLNTIPILKDCIIIGKGAGNYSFCYPHYELAGMLNTHGTTNLLTDKPHNWYLQTIINSGAISLVMLLLLIFTVLKQCLTAIRSENKYIDYSFIISCIAFMFMGLFNDSAVSVSPVFWVMLGTVCK